ncbi:MAG: NAD+ synthase [Phycisphaeraceae bacterium]|nr:NAD+ synthase [Phycisphaeraceae bacterium]
MRLALAQLNPVVGDLEGNARLIADAANEAREAGADLLVCPELGLCGYPPRDLLLQEGFVRDCAAAARQLGEQASRGLTLIFGVPLPVSGDGNDLSRGVYNALLVYRDGAMVDYYDKRLLPTYDVFDEDRYFVPGDRAVVIDVPSRRGPVVRIGLSICEDLWKGEDAGFAHRYINDADPVVALIEAGAKVIVNPSASPFVLGKGRRHREILRRHAIRHGVYVAGVNQVGGNDELIFDGHGAVFDPSGTLIAAAPGFVEHLLVADIPPTGGPGTVTDSLLSAADEELLYRALVLGVRDYCRKTGFGSAAIGLSGGIDSALTAVIAAAALGPSNVTGISMPGPYSSEGSKTDAAELAANLAMPYRTIPIGPGFDAVVTTLRAGDGPVAGVTEENLQSRLRGTVLMAFSNATGAIVLTTGNKSELAVGYCTLYGDMNGGLAVLSDVTKQWVYRLSKWVNAHPGELGIPGLPSLGPIPSGTITKPPSAELRPDQTDEATLGPYAQLDEIIERAVEKRQSPERIARETGFDPAVIKRTIRLIDLSEYKRKQAAVGLKVTGVAFGSGRRYPIAQRYRPEQRL